MLFKEKLYFSSITSVNDNGNIYYRVKFIDDNDDDYIFFMNDEQVANYRNMKKHQECEVTLALYKAKVGRGRFGLAIV